MAAVAAHGSNGVIGDIGIHIVDFATYACANDIVWMESRVKTFHKADGGRIGDYVLDANNSFVMSVELKNGAIGVIHASRWGTGNANTLRLDLFGQGRPADDHHRREVLARALRGATSTP